MTRVRGSAPSAVTVTKTILMKYLQLPDNKVRILPFYLAMEEYAARTLRAEEYFFMWQVEPTVIFGRNQLIDSEVNLEYCNKHNIQYYRRKSGGGCVFADMSNIMFSYVAPSNNVTTTFSHYTHAVAEMLRGLGLNADDTSRNDVLIDGCKVSGNAFYHLPGRSIVHGTMLYDTDMAHMAGAITPSKGKLESKGVESVRQRITTLNQHISLSIDEFKDYVRRTMCDGELLLTDDDVREIEEITKEYLTPEFVLGNNPRCNMEKQARIAGVGEIVVKMELNRNVIIDMNVTGDFFLLGNIDGVIGRLKGTGFTSDAIAHALEGVEMNDIIMNLTTKQFINLLTN